MRESYLDALRIIIIVFLVFLVGLLLYGAGLEKNETFDLWEGILTVLRVGGVIALIIGVCIFLVNVFE